MKQYGKVRQVENFGRDAVESALRYAQMQASTHVEIQSGVSSLKVVSRNAEQKHACGVEAGPKLPMLRK